MTDRKPSRLVPSEDRLRRGSSVTAQPLVFRFGPCVPGISRAAGAEPAARPPRAPYACATMCAAPTGRPQGRSAAVSLCIRPFPDVIRPWLPQPPQARSRWPQGSRGLQQKPPEPAAPQDPQPMGPKPGPGAARTRLGTSHLSAGFTRKRFPPFSLNFCLGLFCFAWPALVSFRKKECVS